MFLFLESFTTAHNKETPKIIKGIQFAKLYLKIFLKSKKSELISVVKKPVSQKDISISILITFL